MVPSKFQRLKRQIRRDLTTEQCLDLEAHLRSIIAEQVTEVSISEREREVNEARTCPRCGNDDVVRHGRDKRGRRRFRCRRGNDVGCGRTFNALTGTAFARMRKPEKLGEFVRRMGTFTSVDRVAASDLGISRLTAWRWRHRLLRAQAELQPQQLGALVEADETFFRTSYKGHRGWRDGDPPEDRPPRYRGGPSMRPGISAEQVPVVSALDNKGCVMEGVLSSRKEIEQALRGRIQSGSVLCSDGLKAYERIAASCHSEHRRIIQPPKKDWMDKALGDGPPHAGRLGLGRINSHHERMKTFVNRVARGVSTRYLPLYLAWQRLRHHQGFSPEDIMRHAVSTPT